MDALHRAVSAAAEAAGRAGEAPATTFQTLWTLAARAAGRPAPVVRARRSAPVPRLTEPWFCCSEPTAEMRER
jgi:hypothetical protein